MSGQCAAISDMPQELLDKIVDFAAVDDFGELDRSTMKSCSLVFRRLRYQSQKNLFSTITLQPKKESFVKYVKMHGFPIHVGSLFGYLIKRGRRPGGLQSYQNELISSYMTKLVVCKSMPPQILQYLTMFCSNLRVLDLRRGPPAKYKGMLWPMDRAWVKQPSSPPRLTSLSFYRDYDLSHIKMLLSCGIDWSEIKFLCAPGIAFNEIVPTCKDLEELWIDGVSKPAGPGIASYNVAHLQNLRKIHVGFVNRGPSEADDNMKAAFNTFTLLRSIDTHHHKLLESITISVDAPIDGWHDGAYHAVTTLLIPLPTSHDWARVDDLICEMGRHRQLAVKLEVNMKYPGPMKAALYLPCVITQLHDIVRNWAALTFPQISVEGSPVNFKLALHWKQLLREE